MSSRVAIDSCEMSSASNCHRDMKFCRSTYVQRSLPLIVSMWTFESVTGIIDALDGVRKKTTMNDPGEVEVNNYLYEEKVHIRKRGCCVCQGHCPSFLPVTSEMTFLGGTDQK